MVEWMPAVKAAVEGGWKVAIPIAAVCAFIIFVPVDGLRGFVAQYGTWVWLAFLASLGVVLNGLLTHLHRRIGEKKAKDGERKQLEEILKALTDEEKRIILLFGSDKRSTHTLPTQPAPVRMLLRHGLITQISGMSLPECEASFAPSDRFWDYLQSTKSKDTQAGVT